MRLVPAEEAARRARAAVGYAGLEVDDVAQQTGIPKGTIRNILSRTRPQSGTLERLQAIADACGVPRSFMEVGFAPLEQPTTDADRRLIEIEQRLARVESGKAIQGMIEGIIVRLDSGEADLEETHALVAAGRQLLEIAQQSLVTPPSDERAVDAAEDLVAQLHGQRQPDDKEAPGARRGSKGR